MNEQKLSYELLCRYPNVKIIDSYGRIFEITGISFRHNTIEIKKYYDTEFPFFEWIRIDECKLVLRDLSSLTDDEKIKWYNLCDHYEFLNEIEIVARVNISINSLLEDKVRLQPKDIDYLRNINILTDTAGDWCIIDNNAYKTETK